jgi:hypothetical protein
MEDSNKPAVGALVGRAGGFGLARARAPLLRSRVTALDARCPEWPHSPPPPHPRPPPTPQYVERLRNEIISNLKHLEHAPGTQFEEVRRGGGPCRAASPPRALDTPGLALQRRAPALTAPAARRLPYSPGPRPLFPPASPPRSPPRPCCRSTSWTTARSTPRRCGEGEQGRQLPRAPLPRWARRPPPASPPTATPTPTPHTPRPQGELPVRERLCKYAREHVLLKENELYEDDTDHAGD